MKKFDRQVEVAGGGESIVGRPASALPKAIFLGPTL